MDKSSPTTQDKAAPNMDFWIKQNPLLYLLVALVLGGHGFDFMASTSLRDDVHAVGKQLDEAMGRLDDEERLSAMFRREIDLLDRRITDLESRVRSLEDERDPRRYPYDSEKSHAPR